MEWQSIILAVLAPTGGGWLTVRVWIAARERREKDRQAREDATAARFEAMQHRYLDAETASQERFLVALHEVQSQLERHRTEHLEDTKLFAQRMTEALQVVQQMQARSSARPSG